MNRSSKFASIFRSARFSTSPVALAKKVIHNSLDHATGLEKRELLAHLAGDCDPFYIMMIKRGQGTRVCPNLIPSAYKQRLMGCVCEEGDSTINFIWLHLNVPKRCGCGYWFELCPVAPFC